MHLQTQLTPQVPLCNHCKKNRFVSFHFENVPICLECEHVLTDWMSAEKAMFHHYGVQTDSECCEESNYNPVFHQNDCNSEEIV